MIVTDLLMPGMSGEDLLGFVKANRPETPVVFISGAADEERARRLLTKGAFDYLSKPFPLEEIARRVARAAAHRRPPPGVNCRSGESPAKLPAGVMSYIRSPFKSCYSPRHA